MSDADGANSCLPALRVDAESSDGLLTTVCSGLHPDAVDWIQSEVSALRAAPDTRRLTRSFAAIARRLPREQSTVGADSAAIHLNTLDMARYVLLRAALDPLDTASRCQTVAALYKTGSTGERCSIARILPCFPSAGSYLTVAVEACRTHVEPVFAAIACENPYPAEHFPELNFNQMVLKAVFVGLQLSRVVGLRSRRGSELQRMARALTSERQAAGRPIPADLSFLSDESMRADRDERWLSLSDSSGPPPRSAAHENG
ncbi:MAG TPA: EboA domain-containing protein [Thermoanaerobaculia bacterium]|nr:EboA domain-containing protein [Thermoanaerobaculia bacterium]